ncbi:hypothetical protein [Lactococcus lactis]|uniref:hypothetical protein n=1 Tax=Lactococcus lactis TaxID=1358 RepID=UPI0025A30747|nr:hypothetical protein [Lactococcus lactis]MDM7500902.1 hypothetical protein [Lactococcus lactis]
MTTIQRLIQFLSTLTPYQQLKFFKLCNQISGSVNIPDTSKEINYLANFIRVQTGGVRNMVAFAKKICYGFEQAETRLHYKTGHTLLDDFVNGKRIYVKSY